MTKVTDPCPAIVFVEINSQHVKEYAQHNDVRLHPQKLPALGSSSEIQVSR